VADGASEMGQIGVVDAEVVVDRPACIRIGTFAVAGWPAVIYPTRGRPSQEWEQLVGAGASRGALMLVMCCRLCLGRGLGQVQPLRRSLGCRVLLGCYVTVGRTKEHEDDSRLVFLFAMSGEGGPGPVKNERALEADRFTLTPTRRGRSSACIPVR
jgi:hypothetical protein